MHPDRNSHAFLNSIDELLSGLRPEIDERLMSDILGYSSESTASSAPAVSMSTKQEPGLPSHQAIADRAYEIYVRTGRLSGTSVQNWLFAKSELEHAARSEVVSRVDRGSVPACRVPGMILNANAPTGQTESSGGWGSSAAAVRT